MVSSLSWGRRSASYSIGVQRYTVLHLPIFSGVSLQFNGVDSSTHVIVISRCSPKQLSCGPPSMIQIGTSRYSSKQDRRFRRGVAGGRDRCGRLVLPPLLIDEGVGGLLTTRLKQCSTERFPASKVLPARVAMRATTSRF